MLGTSPAPCAPPPWRPLPSTLTLGFACTGPSTCTPGRALVLAAEQGERGTWGGAAAQGAEPEGEGHRRGCGHWAPPQEVGRGTQPCRVRVPGSRRPFRALPSLFPNPRNAEKRKKLKTNEKNNQTPATLITLSFPPIPGRGTSRWRWGLRPRTWPEWGACFQVPG